MTRIVLIRHGQTEWNVLGKYQGQSDVALSSEGIQQAGFLAANLEIEGISHLDAVYSSDLKRAKVTASCLAERFHCEVQTRSMLRELNFGAWEGLTYGQITEKWPEAIHNFFSHPDLLDIPEGESFFVLQQRAVKELHSIVQANENSTVAVVAHGAILRTILADVLHMPLRSIWSIRQDNTAVNVLRYDDKGNCLVELINSTAHLRQK